MEVSYPREVALVLFLLGLGSVNCGASSRSGSSVDGAIDYVRRADANTDSSAEAGRRDAESSDVRGSDTRPVDSSGSFGCGPTHAICSAYACDVDAGACKTSCSQDHDCGDVHLCTGGQCVACEATCVSDSDCTVGAVCVHRNDCTYCGPPDASVSQS